VNRPPFSPLSGQTFKPTGPPMKELVPRVFRRGGVFREGGSDNAGVLCRPDPGFRNMHVRYDG